MKLLTLALVVGVILFPNACNAQVASSWLTPTDGDWTDSTNWSTDPLAPLGPNDTATLAAVGSPYTATISTGVSIDQINIDSPDATVLLQGGTLTSTGGVFANQSPLLIESGTISNTRLGGAAGVQVNDGANNLYSRPDRTRLEQVTLATTLSIAPGEQFGAIELANSLILEQGEILLNGLELYTNEALTISGSGNIVGACCEFTEWNLSGSGADVTIGSGVTVRASEASVLFIRETRGRPSFENHGTLEAAGGQFYFLGDIEVTNPNGVFRSVDGGYLSVGDFGGPVGTVELGPNSTISLSGSPTLSQPLTIPTSAQLTLGGDWQSMTSVHIAGGTLSVINKPFAGTWSWGEESTLQLRNEFTIAQLASYGIAEDTTVSFLTGGQSSPRGRIDLLGEVVDLDGVPGVWDFANSYFRNGTIVGMPNEGLISTASDDLLLAGVTIDTPIEVADGRLRIDDSSVTQPLTVSGGYVSTVGNWSNTSIITVDGGILDLGTLPASLGTISLLSGEVVLPSTPSDPSELQVSGGTIAIENVDYVVADLEALPWSPAAYAPAFRSTLDLEGNTFDLSAGPWTLGLSGGTIENGTLERGTNTEPMQVRHGFLSNVVIKTDMTTANPESTIYLNGDITVINSALTGRYQVTNSGNSNLTLDDVTIQGEMEFNGTSSTLSPVIVRNGLTLNGTMNLGVRYLQLEGTQTIDGNGIITTDGIRGFPGGGIEVVNGSLILGPDFTFHSRRNGSKIIVDGPNLTNEGTIIADVDDYGSRHQDVPEPGLTIAVDGQLSSGHDFFQNGVMKIIDGYEIRVEAYEIHNAGEIELRGGDLTGSGVELINTGEFRGRGTFVSTGDGIFDNQGTLAVGDLEAFGEDETAEIGALLIVADFTQDTTGQLLLDLAGDVPGSEYDQLLVAGAATLGGRLEVSLLEGFVPLPGQPLEIFTALGGVQGTFDEVLVTTSLIGLDWELVYAPTSVSLLINSLAGDFNADGTISGTDFLAWQRGDLPSPLSAEDLANWQSNYGAGSTLAATSTAVPEPTSWGLLLLAMLSTTKRRCR